MHKRKVLRPTPALKLRLLRFGSIHPSNISKWKHVQVTLKYYLGLLSSLIRRKSTMGYASSAKIVVYIEFGFLGLGTLVAGILVLFPSFFLDVLLQEFVQDTYKREQLRGELGTLTTLGSAVIAIALLLWLIVVLTLCQGVRGISPPRLMIWLVINFIPTAAGIAAVSTLLIMNPDTLTMHIPGISFLLYKLWSLIVVRGLRKDIKAAGPPDNFHVLQHRQSRSYSTHSTHLHGPT